MSKFINSQIISVQKENEQVSSFLIHPVPAGFSLRKPGQYLLMKLLLANVWSSPHPFTLTGSPDEDHLKITVKKIGDFTTALHSISPPVDVQISGPLGDYGATINTEKKLVFIAGGIGITPFISLLKALNSNETSPQITLFWANNKAEEYFDLDFLNELAARNHIKVILVSLEKKGATGRGGDNLIWQQGHLTADLFATFIEDKTAKFYMCGSENMQKYVFSQIQALGITPENVETEKIGIYMKNSPEPVSSVISN